MHEMYAYMRVKITNLSEMKMILGTIKKTAGFD